MPDEVYITGEIGDFYLDLIAGPDEITVTTTSQTLEEMGIELQNGTQRVTIIPSNSPIYWAKGTAVVGVNRFPPGGVELECKKCGICDHEFITASGTAKLSVVQEGGGIT